MKPQGNIISDFLLLFISLVIGLKWLWTYMIVPVTVVAFWLAVLGVAGI